MSINPASNLPLRQSTPMPAVAPPTVQVAVGQCWLGVLLVASSTDGICAILFGDTEDELVQELSERFPGYRLIPADDGDNEPALVSVRAFLDNPMRPFSLALDMHGTPFQERVWNALLTIPVGTTTTYTELASQIGTPTAARAVANACGANLLAGVVPCHRVIRQDGTISGYRCGIERKRQLLAHEARLASTGDSLFDSNYK